MKKTNEWQTFFDGHAPDYMDNIFTKNTLAEVDFLIDELKLEPGCRILDMGCGTGRHSVELARRGFRMTGVDLSSGMLGEARKVATEAGVEVEWVQCNASTFKSPPVFDAAICLCEGSFGLLGSADDPFEHELTILDNLRAALKPGGKLVITLLNGMAMIRKATEETVASGQLDPLTLVETHHEEWEMPDGQKCPPGRERSFVPPEIVLMLRCAGFEVQNIWGGTAGNWGRRPVDLDEIEIMAVARKPQ